MTVGLSTALRPCVRGWGGAAAHPEVLRVTEVVRVAGHASRQTPDGASQDVAWTEATWEQRLSSQLQAGLGRGEGSPWEGGAEGLLRLCLQETQGNGQWGAEGRGCEPAQG